MSQRPQSCHGSRKKIGWGFLPRGFGAVVIAAAAGLLLLPAVLPATTALAETKPLKKKPAAPVAAAPEQSAAPAAKPASSAVPMLPGAGSKEPINIDAAKLDYFDKDQKMVYTGDVVAVQGDSTLKASVLTIFLQKNDPAPTPGAAPAPPPPPGAPSAGSQVKKMEAEGPVTLISKDQIGTGDSATYDKEDNKVYLNGNVTLTQGTNVTLGDHLVYDMTSGLAQVFSGPSNDGRVHSVFTPGSGGPDPAADGGKKDKAAKDKPASATRKPVAGPKSAASSVRRDAEVQ